jgi:hypothetical protein
MITGHRSGILQDRTGGGVETVGVVETSVLQCGCSEASIIFRLFSEPNDEDRGYPLVLPKALYYATTVCAQHSQALCSSLTSVSRLNFIFCSIPATTAAAAIFCALTSRKDEHGHIRGHAEQEEDQNSAPSGRRSTLTKSAFFPDL